MSKSSDKREEIMKKDPIASPAPVKVQMKWRYFCEACTGAAMYGYTPGPFASVACMQCGKVQPYSANNWLPMSEAEIAKHN